MERNRERKVLPRDREKSKVLPRDREKPKSGLDSFSKSVYQKITNSLKNK